MRIRPLLCLLLILALAPAARAQHAWRDRGMMSAWSVDSIGRGGYTLIFVNRDPAFPAATKQRMIDAYFRVYPREVRAYNNAALKTVVLVVDPAYKGVAATDDGLIRVNPAWMNNHPEDVDIVTHEAMHIVQAYPEDSGPGWITEGIADYVRYTLGVNNEAAGWRLPDVREGQSYEDAYRVTARFFVWIERHQARGTMARLDQAMRTRTYTDDFWRLATGKTVDQLWMIYQAHPDH